MPSDIRLEDILDLGGTGELVSSIANLAGLPVTITSMDGKTLVAAGWQEVCARYHRSSPAGLMGCLYQSKRMPEICSGDEPTLCDCPNGMKLACRDLEWRGQAVGRVHICQFLTEAPDKDAATARAARMGWNQEGYLRAMQAAPVVFSESVFETLRLVHDLLIQQLERGLALTGGERPAEADGPGLGFYRELLDKVPTVLLVSDALSGRVLEASARACSFFGQERPELFAHRLHDLCTGGDQDVMVRTSSVVIEGREMHVTVVQELEEQAMEPERAEAAELLRQARMLHSLTPVTSGIVNEFNNVLSAILGFAEIASTEVAEGSFAEQAFKRITDGGRRAADLVEKIRGFGQLRRSPGSKVDLAWVVERCAELARARTGRHIDIVLDCPPRECLVCGDALDIMRAVDNICQNAADALAVTGGRLCLSLVSEENAAGETTKFVISVADDGPGMSPEVQEAMFHPFFTTKRSVQGAGLGLTAARSIIMGHGGFVGVKSGLGSGTTVSLGLPPLPQQAEYAGNRCKTNIRGSERIMLVDDEVDIVSVTTELLSRVGYQVEGFTCPDDAWRAFSERPGEYDLLITDQIMPRITGAELARRVTELRPGFPVLVCTGYSSELMSCRGNDNLAGTLMQKPIAFQQLARQVRRVLDGLVGAEN